MYVLRPSLGHGAGGIFSQGEEKGKKVNDMRKNEAKERGYAVPTGLCMRPVQVCVYVHEVEKAVALWRGRALLSLAGREAGGLG